MLNVMAERRLQLSINTVGDLLWLYAWVDARQPVLEGIQESENPFVEEIKINHKITPDDAKWHTH
jgi:hypothetical protein